MNAKKYVFSMAGNRPTFEEDGVEDTELIVTKAQSEGRYSIMISRWLSTFEVPPHFHKEHAETFYVLDGQVEWTVEGETRVLNAGDALYIPPNAVHSVRVLGGKDSHNILIYEPGGYEDQVDFKMNYAAEELKDPEVRDRIRKMSDFNVVE
ncbi:MAG: cupin domain-containing protein [Anaerolineales bacterium]|nr:cupin domain-containing protein [Anaerolineales bacterium]